MKNNLVWCSISLVTILALGCAKAKPTLQSIQPGMTEDAVIEQIGEPASVALHGQAKIYRYESWDMDFYHHRTNIQEFYVRFVNGVVESFGRMGDFDSTKNPTSDININHKMTTKAEGDAVLKSSRFDLADELKKLDQMKKDGLLTQQEYESLRQRVIDKAKAQ